MSEAAIEDVLDGLSKRWAPVDRRLMKQAFALLRAGHAVSVESLAYAAGIDRASVEKVVRSSHAGTDEAGDITELFGIGIEPMTYRITFDDVAVHACCGLVAHTASDIFGRPVVIRCQDPVTSDPIEVHVNGDDVETAIPERVVATLVRVDADTFTGNIGANFCTHVRHFARPETAARFCAEDDRRIFMPLERFHAAAHALYSKLWKFDDP